MIKMLEFLRIGCKEATMLCTKQCDVNLTWAERIRMRIHFLSCKPCLYFSKQLQVLQQSLKNLVSNTAVSFSEEEKMTLQEKIDKDL